MTNPITEPELVQGHGGRVSVTYEVEVYGGKSKMWHPIYMGRSEECARKLLEEPTGNRKRLVRVTLEMKREVVE